MSSKKKISLEDIFNDDDFGLLDAKAKTSNVKTKKIGLLIPLRKLILSMIRMVGSLMHPACLNMGY